MTRPTPDWHCASHPCGCPASLTPRDGRGGIWYRDGDLIVECPRCGATWLMRDERLDLAVGLDRGLAAARMRETGRRR